ncbi:MAG: ATP-binding protein [Rickettsiales bacterium]
MQILASHFFNYALISITTKTCYINNFSHALISAIANRFILTRLKHNEIITCMHEALMNSILHGNLNLKSNFTDKEGFYSYQDKVSHLLKITYYRNKRIYIKVWNNSEYLRFSIQDEGDGFEIPDFTINNAFPKGRGLMFINSLADEMRLGDDNKTLYMTFRH